jgi:hypothetical protein
VDKERERYRRWAKKLEVEFNADVFDDLVMLHGLRGTVEDLDSAYLDIQMRQSLTSVV